MPHLRIPPVWATVARVLRRLLPLCLVASVGCATEAHGADAARDGATPLGADAGPPDAGPPDAGPIDADADTDADAAVEETDPTILTNFSFDTAKRVEVDSIGVLQPLESADQVDYYAFDAEAGEFYVITTNRGRFTPDNVIKLYGPSREKLAENDAGWLWPGDAVDARLVVRARETGRHYVVIEDRVLPDAAFSTEGVPTFFYRVTVQHAAPSTVGIGWEAALPEAVALVRFAEHEPTGIAYVTLLGELHEGEVDRFQLQGRVGQVLVGHVLPGGVTGNGSTLTTGHVAVRDASGHVVAEIDRALGVQLIHPPLGEATYTLSVSTDGALGDNAFYAIDLVLLMDNPHEEASDNDALESAHPLPLAGGFLRRGTLLAELPPLDVDYYAFEAMAGDRIDVVCEAASAGSGVRGLVAEIRDGDDAVLGAAEETLEGGLRLERVMVEQAGTYYLRLSSQTSADSAAPDAWVRCAVIAEI